MEYSNDNLFGSEMMIYTTEDGLTKIETTFDGDTVWLSADQMAELFQRDKSTISRHIKNIFTEGELVRDSVVAKFATTAADGKTYQVEYYNLDVIISVGYRVKSKRGTQFRIWATGILKEYMRKGFALDDERLLNWFILQTINRRYIKNVDILKIIKASDENEAAKSGNLFLLILGALLVPVGIIIFFTLQNIGGFLCTLLAFIGLAGAVWGVYLLIVQCASIGDILKKYNDKAYYKNIVFYNLLKQKIRQYTRSIFAATLLITFTVFGIGFIAAGFIDGYNVALNEPYDYTINATCEHPMTEKRIEEIAEESNAVITDIKHIDCLLLGVQNHYKNGERDWSSRIVVSEDNFNVLSGAAISVPKGSYTVYYDSSMEYKLNAFSADNSLFYNPTTEQEFTLTQNEPICRDRLFNTRSVFSSFLILNNEDYRTIAATIADEYRAVSYMVNVENWQDTMDFQNNILKAVISDNNGVIFTNWHNSATFAKTGSQAEFLPFEGNETRIARVWSLYPLSKLSSTTTQFEAFATYLMLMLFIAIVAFVSAVMVIGLKLISMIWDDTEVYNDLQRLGMKSKRIKELITKQMLFVYFIPAVPGCIIGAFTTYRIMLVSGVIYIGKTMQLVGCVCCLVVIIQSTIFLILREVVADKMLNTPLHLSA